MIDEGLASLGRLAPEDRSILALRQLLGQRDPEGIGARLEKWARGGSLGWVFDNEIDALSLEAPFVGFDMTDFLDNPEVRTPLMMRSEEHTSELQSLMRISYAVFCLKKKKQHNNRNNITNNV